VAYEDLGPRTGVVSKDPTTGFWVVSFTPDNIASRLSLIECYHIYLTGPAGSSFDVMRNSQFWGASPNGYKNEWDPQQPMPLRAGDTVTFKYSTGADPQPQVTMWLRTETS
jgi:hypothetical protein